MRKYAYPVSWLIVSAAAAWSIVSFRGLPPPPRLAVVIVVDQLRPDYLTRFSELYAGGFKTLLDNGANFTNAAYRHASTHTAAGHASVSTGLHPSTHGMIDNSWYDPTRDAVVNCVADDAYAAVGGPGRRASPRPLLADTLGDLLKRKHGGSKVYAFALKDRSALMLAGRGADGAFWYSVECGCFVTSSYYENGMPQWLAAFNATRPTAKYAGKVWKRLLADRSLYEKLAREDAFPTENEGQAATFPHTLPQEDPATQIRLTPFADELTLQAALAALDSGELGTDGEPDLLAVASPQRIISAIATALQSGSDGSKPAPRPSAGRSAGGNRPPGRDRENRGGSDRRPRRLALGRGTATPRRSGEPREPRRVLAARAGTRSSSISPDAPDLVAYAGGNRLYWRLPAFRNGAVERAAAEKFLVERLRQHPLVAGVYTASELANVSDRAPEMTRLFANAYFQRRSPHLIVRFNEFVYAGGAFGTAHGTAYPYDREVPVLLYGAGDTPREFRAAGGARRYRPDPGQDASPQNGAGAGHAHSLGSAAITARDKSRASVVTRPGGPMQYRGNSQRNRAPCCPPGK